MAQDQWRAVRQPNGTVDTDLYNLELRDAFDRFDSGATAWFFDSDGTKQDDYPRAQRVEFQISTDGGSTWSTRLATMVQDVGPTDEDGLPAVKAECVAYDHFLRGEDVYKTYSSSSISTILKDLIQTFTGVTWNASNVTVQNDKTITREFKGEKVDEAIAWLASISADEEFGVNNSLEFFFEQQGTTSAAALGDTEITSHDIPTEGKPSVNRVRVFYGSSGSESFVTVQDREAQKNLKDNLNASSNVVLSKTDTFPEIGSEDRAKEKAQQILSDRSVVQKGTVTTFGRYDTDAGDVFSLTIDSAGITDENFRAAQVTYNWVEGTTEIALAENVGNVTDLLAQMSDALANVRGRDADPSASGTDFFQFQSGVELSRSATVRQKSIDSACFQAGFGSSGSQASFEPVDNTGFQFDSYSSATIEGTIATRALLNACRDVWQGESAPGISHIGFGTADDQPTVADNSLTTQVDRKAIGIFDETSTAEQLQFDGFLTPRDTAFLGQTLREFGFFNADSGNDMYAHVTMGDTAHDGTVETHARLTMTVDTDGDEQGVVTTTGQQRLVDLLIGETGHDPSDMVYGTGSKTVQESVSSLATKVHEDTLNSTADRSTGITDVVERIGSGEENGQDLTELGEQNSSNELVTYIVFEAYSKTSSAALETNHRFRASNA